jgi:hypothetical protein
MRPVERSEIMPLGDYESVREQFRTRVIELKRQRRVALGEHISVMFENRDTVLLQIQEMLRTERITSEAAIAHEIATYNELVPGPNQLSMTLFIEIPDKELRERILVELAGMESHVAIAIDGTRCVASAGHKDGAEQGRTTAVQYYIVELPPETAERLRSGTAEHVALVCDHPAYDARTRLDASVVAQLTADLAEP